LKTEIYTTKSTNNMKYKILLLLLIFASFFYKLKGQEIELIEVWVDCVISENDTILYQPTDISFRLEIINTSNSNMLFGAYYFPLSKRKPKYGYFDIKIGGSKKNIKMRSNYYPICMAINDTLSISTELYQPIFNTKGIKNNDIIKIENDRNDSIVYVSNNELDGGLAKYLFEEIHSSDFNSFAGIINHINNIEIYYRSIKKDYRKEKINVLPFPNKKVNINNYFVTFTNGDITIDSYYIESGKISKIQTLRNKQLGN